jgi:hypothetical protein
LAQGLGREPDVAKALIVLVQEVVDGREKGVDKLLELWFSSGRCGAAMQAGACIEQELAVRPAELVELLLKGPDDVELGGTDLRQPVHPLLLVTERATGIKAAPALQVVPGAEMAAGPPGAERLVAGVGGDETGRLERRTGIEVLRERARIRTAVGVLFD